MSSTTKLYHSILYLSQFVVDHSAIEDIILQTPKLLDRLKIQNVNVRITIVDKLDLFLKDLKSVQLKGNTEKYAQVTRKFLFRYIVLLGLLVNLTSWKNLAVNLAKFRLDALVSLSEVKNLGLISLSVSSISSFIPFLKLSLDKLHKSGHNLSVSSVVVSSLSIIAFPKGYARDYITLYSLTSGIDSLLKYLKLKTGIDLYKPGAYVPFALSAIYHNYIIHPEYLPGYLIKFMNFMNDGLFESKARYIKQWDDVSTVIKKVKESAILKNKSSSTVLLNSSLTTVSKYQPHPLHNNRILSLTNPSQPSLFKVLLRYIPKKIFVLTVATLPLFILRSRLKGQFKDFYDEQGELDVKLIWKGLQQPLKSTLKLSTVLVLIFASLFTLTVKNNFSRSPLKNFKYIGLVSGLLAYAYNDTPEIMPIISYVLRTGLLSVKKNVEKKHKLRYLDSGLIGTGFGLLTTLYETGHGEVITPQRVLGYLSVIYSR